VSRLRFSIASLLFLVLFLGVSLAALREANDLWDSAVFTATLAILLVAVLLAVHRAKRARAFWLGFAVFGWVYLVAGLVPAIESRLPSSKVLAWLDAKVRHSNDRATTDAFMLRLFSNQAVTQQEVKALAFIPATRAETTYEQLVVGRLLTGSGGTTQNFIRIGHALIALVLAWVGGRLSRFLYVSNRQPEGIMTVEQPERKVTEGRDTP
jgi:hypothetical protein